MAALYEYASHQPLRSYLTPIVKYTENVLRQQAGYRGRLRVEGLEDDVKQLFDGVLLPASEPAQGAVDLLVEGDPSPARSMPIPPRQQAASTSNASGSARPSRPAPTIQIDYARMEELAQDSEAIFQLLNTTEEADGESGRADTVLGAGADTDAETGADTGADTGNNRETVTATAPSAQPTHFSENGIEPPEQDPHNEMDEWQYLVDALSPVQRCVLELLSQPHYAPADLEDLARQHASMPSLLLDTFNKLAQGTMGDLLIRVDAEPPVIEEEYADSIKQRPCPLPREIRLNRKNLRLSAYICGFTLYSWPCCPPADSTCLTPPMLIQSDRCTTLVALARSHRPDHTGQVMVPNTP